MGIFMGYVSFREGKGQQGLYSKYIWDSRTQVVVFQIFHGMINHYGPLIRPYYGRLFLVGFRWHLGGGPLRFLWFKRNVDLKVVNPLSFFSRRDTWIVWPSSSGWYIKKQFWIAIKLRWIRTWYVKLFLGEGGSKFQLYIVVFYPF